jgi:hypothetical protein
MPGSLFPPKIVVGEPYASTTYFLEEHWLTTRRSLTALSPPGSPALHGILTELGLVLVDIRPSRGSPLEEYQVLRISGTLTVDTLSRLNERLAESLIQLEDVAPVYLEESRGWESAATPRLQVLLVRPREGVLPLEIETLLTQEGYTRDLEEADGLAPRLFIRFVTHHELVDSERALALRQRVRSHKDIISADFDWVKLRAFLAAAVTPNDPYWPRQWDMKRIRLDEALAVGSPGPTVKIAVIDAGFDQNHPDLSVVQHKSLRQRSTPLFTLEAMYDCFVEPSAHGTAVTGIASAIRDNHEGIVGVACGFPIVAISVDSDLPSSQLAQALDIAVEAGAKVINMSLAAVPTGDIIVAIQAAWAKGCVLCAAAGNSGNANVVFPASCDEVIAVGACDQNDLRKKYRKANDEKWSSSYGEKLDVMAPGILCWTTDERGEAGYNQDGGPKIYCGHYYMCSGDPAGNYTSYFHGTSAACPHVAGLAALLLAIHPVLTNQEVRDIIEGACDRVHPEEYQYYKAAGRPNGDWHWEMGYGRINCYTAVLRAELLRGEARLAQQRLRP